MLVQCRARHVNESISIQQNSKFLISIIIKCFSWMVLSLQVYSANKHSGILFSAQSIIEVKFMFSPLEWSNLRFLSILVRIISFPR